MKLLQEISRATEECYDVSSFEAADVNECVVEKAPGLHDCSVFADNDLAELDAHNLEGDWFVVGYTATTIKHWDAGVARFTLEDGALHTLYTGFESADSDVCFPPEMHTHVQVEGRPARFATVGSNSANQTFH